MCYCDVISDDVVVWQVRAAAARRDRAARLRPGLGEAHLAPLGRAVLEAEDSDDTMTPRGDVM
jgi:hypothetical protein